jgi:hypothetical protein
MRLEWLILTDAAQIADGKLFLIGGGWDTIRVNALPHRQKMAIALAIEVEWVETNERHALQLEIATQDGNVLVNLNGAFEMGRPPGISAGQSQRVQLVVDAEMEFQELGMYVITVTLGQDRTMPVRFNVMPTPFFQFSQQGSAGQGGPNIG